MNMKLEVTREIVSDLWSLYQSGEASADSRTLVDSFLAHDRTFESMLQASKEVTRAMPAGLRLSPDAERRLLDDARGRARLKLLVVGAGIALAGSVMLIALGGVLLLTLRGF